MLVVFNRFFKSNYQFLQVSFHFSAVHLQCGSFFYNLDKNKKYIPSFFGLFGYILYLNLPARTKSGEKYRLC